jgi:hypothetical protein
MHLNVKRFALASGVLWGLALFGITLVATGRGIGDHLSHLSSIFIGYQVSYLGSLIGLVYGFLTGLVGGALFAVIYNGSQKDRTA